jgi:beta-lactamase superfamily II metal-dependent hydrolase/catechol 2,3-dioxygenase-like lactoylglutathione lyase family enzyme
MHMVNRPLLLVAAIAAGLAATDAIVHTQARNTLEIYSIDVEGGQSTLFVSPTGASLLVDTGSPGDRDASRIAAVVKDAGVRQIDYLLITHYDGDHVGGVKDLAARIPIRSFVDHGPRVQDPAQTVTPQSRAYVERTDKAYAETVATGNHIQVKPGDTIPIAGLEVRVVAAGRAAITSPLPGGGAPNPLCAGYQPHDVDHSENSFSVGAVITYGRFRMLDLGDLTWNKEHDLVCPSNLLGTVDVYLTTHHGLSLSGPPVLVHAVRPRVALMNNGPKKGGSRETWATLKAAPGLEDVWQLHYSVQRPGNPGFYETGEQGGKELNAAEPFIANLDEDAAHSSVHYIKVSARADGGFVVRNSRNDFSKEYKAQQAGKKPDLPMPKYHHIHVNAVDPDRSIDWYARYWPAGRKTTVAGFPAFQGGDLYLLYTKVAARGPGAFDKQLHRSVPQSAFWTFGSGVADTEGLVDRLTKLDRKAFEFLPVYSSPDDRHGVIRSALAPQGDQLLTVTQLKERAAREKNGPAAQRPGNQDFGYLVDPDGMLVEFNSAPADHFWQHNHFWHEQPLCAANWYVEHLGMRLAPIRDPKTGQLTERDRNDPCDVSIGEVGYPSFMPQGQLRIPIGNVRFANGSWAWYTRQCRNGRCGAGNDKPLSPSHGLVVDHVALAYPDLDEVMAHLKATNVPIVKGPYKFGDSRAIMIEDLDGLSLELIETK